MREKKAPVSERAPEMQTGRRALFERGGIDRD
jgi:hypothetical protein